MKKTSKEKAEKKWSLYDVSFRYSGVEYDYDSEYDCQENGCNDDCACRCGTIVNTRVTNVDLPRIAEEIIRDRLGYRVEIDPLDTYCVERILRHHKAYEFGNYEVLTCGGYYGEEIDAVRLEKNESTMELERSLISFFNPRKPCKKIEFILDFEYDRVLPKLMGREWTIESIDRDRLDMGSRGQLKMVKNQDVSMYKGWKLPLGIAISSGKRYRLIDGYHRVEASKGDTVLMVVGR